MLPKIDVPTYEMKLPSNGQEVTFRPFLVKEEKLLLMAAQSKDTQEIIKTTKQVLNNCVVSDIDINTLPFFDIDYLFVALRAKSVGEKIEVNYLCLAPQDDGSKCQGNFKVNLDILNIGVEKDEDQVMDIQFHNDLMFKMKYPTYEVMKTISDKDDTLEMKTKVIMACVDKIFANGQYYTNKDFTPDELRGFIEGLTQEQFKKLEDFTNNFPSFYVKGEGQCPQCGKYHNVRYKDFINFFR